MKILSRQNLLFFPAVFFSFALCFCRNEEKHPDDSVMSMDTLSQSATDDKRIGLTGVYEGSGCVLTLEEITADQFELMKDQASWRPEENTRDSGTVYTQEDSTLFLLLENGTRKAYVNHVNTDYDDFVFYHYYSRITGKKFYFFTADRYEGERGSFLVNAQTGEETDIPEYTSLSPDGRRLLACRYGNESDMDIESGLIEIIDMNGGLLHPVFEMECADWAISKEKWLDKNTIALRQEIEHTDRTEVHYAIVRIRWKQ